MKSLKALGNPLSDSSYQIEILEKNNGQKRHFPSFKEKLKTFGMSPLRPTELEILQVNVGKMCNQTCTHCHVDAGPDRKEIMTKETLQHCFDALKQCPSFHTVDITGGAPEMNPHFRWFVEQISMLERKAIVRSNLTILVSNKKFRQYPAFFAKHKVIVIASLPCYTAENTDKQRGNGVFNKSIEALNMLNELGYGKENSGLELHLVYNPVGAHLPPSQQKLEADYKKMLLENFGIVFNNLYTITNIPISRFLEYLLAISKYEQYMETLVNAFNPSAVAGLMCRNTISVGWDGKLYDCDFNQMLDLTLEQKVGQHISDFKYEALKKRNIILKQHCYGCTAGSGSSCQGALI
ncbi:MAG: radical SAM protein [Flavobacteriales bacterium]|nr:MAG: radical SAM protein [Flavobacteriales bacterium]